MYSESISFHKYKFSTPKVQVAMKCNDELLPINCSYYQIVLWYFLPKFFFFFVIEGVKYDKDNVSFFSIVRTYILAPQTLTLTLTLTITLTLGSHDGRANAKSLGAHNAES